MSSSSGREPCSGPERPSSAGEATRVGITSPWERVNRVKWLIVRLKSQLFSSDRGYGTCEIDWVKANYSTIHKSYIISILIFCFFVPVLIMLFSYISIINTVKRGNAMSAEGDLTDRQRKLERDVTIVSLNTSLL